MPDDVRWNRVLVVDDSASSRGRVAGLLREVASEVLQAQSGEEAWGIVCTQPLDLVVTDYAMPTMTGLELLGRMRLLPPGKNPPVVLMSEADQDIEGIARRDGAAAIFSKASDREVFFALLADVRRTGAVVGGRTGPRAPTSRAPPAPGHPTPLRRLTVLAVRYETEEQLLPDAQTRHLATLKDVTQRGAAGLLFDVLAPVESVPLSVPSFWLGVLREMPLEAMVITSPSRVVQFAAKAFARAVQLSTVKTQVKVFSGVQDGWRWVLDTFDAEAP